MRILIIGLNYSPEPIGIGPYTADMARWLASRGHTVEAIAAQPYYPDWQIAAAWRGGTSVMREEKVQVTRCPIYVPVDPNGFRRIAHHASFAATIVPPIIRALRRSRPDVIFAVAPSLLAAPVIRCAARLANVPSWLHVQDFEVGAALATGLIRSSMASAAAKAFERFAMNGFNYYSSISAQMCARLRMLGISEDRVYELRNWTNLDEVAPLTAPSPYRAEWGITTPHVALYSGNIANKQGIGLLLDAARRLQARNDLTFVICGDGPQRARLEAEAAGLTNIIFRPLQPRTRLGELMGLASVHLLPQLAGAADLVLPSKMTNMLASGRPIIATALPATGIATELTESGIVVPPGDNLAFADGIAAVCDDLALATRLGRAARARAQSHWARDKVLIKFETALENAADSSRPERKR